METQHLQGSSQNQISEERNLEQKEMEHVSKKINISLTVQCTDGESDSSTQQNAIEPPREPSDGEPIQEECAPEENLPKQETGQEPPVNKSCIVGVPEKSHGDGNSPQHRNVGGSPDTAPATARGEADGQESDEKCGNYLSKMGYNDRAHLSDLLDNHGIEGVIEQLLSVEEFVDIWRACNGGRDPAMGLIFTLAQSKLTTLENLKEIANRCGSEKFRRLIDTITNYPGYRDKKDKRLDQLPFDFLAKIASEISERPKLKGALWKNIAGEAGLSPQDIRNLDMPVFKASQRESMTMKFIEIVNQRYPEKKVAWLVRGLSAASRHDVIADTKLFADCRKHCCKHLFPSKN